MAGWRVWRIGGRLRERWHAWLWGDLPAPPESATGLRRVAATLTLAIHETGNNDLPTRASALAFWSLLSLVPLLTLVFAIVQTFGVLEGSAAFVLGVLSAGHSGLADAMREYVRATESVTLGGIGVLGLIVVGFTVLQRVKRSLNLIWRVERWPGYGARILEYLIVLSLTPFLLLLPVAASALAGGTTLQVLRNIHPLFSELYARLAGLWGYPIYWIVLVYVYAFLPDTRVRLRYALLGAVTAGTVLQLAQHLYIGAMLRLTVYNVIYGALALLPVLMIWLFLAAVIFLFGAQLAYVGQHYEALFRERAQPSGANRPDAGGGLSAPGHR